MRLSSFAVLLSCGLSLGYGLPFMKSAIAQPQAANRPSPDLRTQCLHPEWGRTACEVTQDLKGDRIQIRWPDQSTTEISLENNTAQIRYTEDSDWQSAHYVGVCWQEECFQTRARELEQLRLGNEKVVAQCYHPQNGTTACYVESLPLSQQMQVSWLNGMQTNISLAAPQTNPWDNGNLGLCIDNVCAFKIETNQPQRWSPNQIGQTVQTRDRL